MKPLVVTSINPRSRFEHQRSCFDRWNSLGFEALTYNIESEAAELVRLGVRSSNIVRIAAEQSGIAPHKIPSPLIKAVLENVATRENDVPVILVNSDIYPAIRKSTTQLSLLSPCAALTRNEVISVEAGFNLAPKPYRGGLDAFYLSPQSLQKLLELISRDSASARMAFGVPGWDFYLGGYISSPELGGMILDADFLLHVSHPTTYSDIAEFGHYVEPLMRLGMVASNDYSVAAHEFATRIDTHCRSNAHVSRALSHVYRNHGKTAECTASPINLDLLARLQLVNAQLPPSQHLDARYIARLSHQQEITYWTLKIFFEGCTGAASRYVAHLRSLFIHLAAFWSARNRGRPLTAKYPASSLHAKAVDHILHIADPEECRLQALELFASELLNYGILNKRMLGYLCLCCRNSDERILLTEICGLLKGEVHGGAN